MTEQTHRKVLTDMIAEIINLPDFETTDDKVIAFASLYQRLFIGNSDITRITGLATRGCDGDREDPKFYERCSWINARIHVMTDDEGDAIWDKDGSLSDKWEADIDAAAVMLANETPEAFLPSATPIELHTPYHANNVPLINNSKKYQYQPEKFKPDFYRAINAMQAQGYVLNKDMMALRNLPIAINMQHNYAARRLVLANTEAFSEEFFFNYTVDYRGRAYARSLFVTPQGDSFAKASLNFANAKPLGQYGFGALAIHYANASGHDKISLVDRVAWAKGEGYEKAFDMVKCKGDWVEIAKLIEDPKHCFEEYTAAMEFYRAANAPVRSNFLSSLVTHQDATNSGFQFGAALTSCRQTAQLVNITDDLTKFDKPADLYGKMAINMHEFINVQQDKYLNDWKPVIDRKFCKKPIMTTGYGAGINTIMGGSEKKKGSQGILQYMIELVKIKPQYMDLVSRHEELRPCVESSLEATASAMLHITDTFQRHADKITQMSDIIEWYTPDGFRVVQCKRDNSHRKLTLSNGAATYLKAEGKDPLDEDGMVTAISPNFIHSIDAQMLRTAALYAHDADIAYAPIHDSFGTHAGSFFELNGILREAFVDTMEYPWYSKFCESNHVEPNMPRLGNYDYHEALQAVYMFS